MYAIAILRYRKSLDEVLPHVDSHRAYVRDQKERGLVLVSGIQEPRYGGILLLRVPDHDSQVALDRFRDDAIAAFKAKNIEPAVPTELTVANYFELPDPPYPPPGVALRSWKVEVGFVCHDVKFGGDAAGVFAWPDEPTDWALRTMQFLLMADTMAMRGDGPDWANDCDVLSVKVTETEAPADYALD
jgi:uncharacterized protein YciI